MRIAYIADGRAEHTRRWLNHFQQTDDEVMLLSTYPCDDSLRGCTSGCCRAYCALAMPW